MHQIFMQVLLFPLLLLEKTVKEHKNNNYHFFYIRLKGFDFSETIAFLFYRTMYISLDPNLYPTFRTFKAFTI